MEIKKCFKGFKHTDGHDEDVGHNEELENNANVIHKSTNGKHNEHVVSKGDNRDREMAVITSQNGDLASGEMP